MARLNFDDIEAEVKLMGTNAQATLLYRLVQQLGPGVTRTLIRYCCKHLDELNDSLPDSDPGKQTYKHKRKQHDRTDQIYMQGVDKYQSSLPRPIGFVRRVHPDDFREL